jgi:Spy/CpxP family protein refolding chaperone
MKKAMTWVALAVVGTMTLAGFAVAPALAQQVEDEAEAQVTGVRHHGPRGGGMGMGLRLIRALDLTEEQLEQARALREETREGADGLRDQIRTEVQALVPRIKDGSLAQSDLVSAHRRIHEIQGKLGQQRAETLYKVYGILTPEQREKLGTLIEERLEDGRGFGFGLFGDDAEGRGHGGRGHGDGARGPRAVDGADDDGPQSARPAPAERGSRGERRANGRSATPTEL